MSFSYMPFFTGDYLRDTRHLTPMRHGAYLLMLMYCWDQKGPMPLDEQECAGICNARGADEIEAMRYILARYFVKLDDGYYNKRMAEEVTKGELLSSKNRQNGLKSAAIKRERVRTAVADKRVDKSTTVERPLNDRTTTVQRPSVSPSPTPYPYIEKEKDGAEAPDVWGFGIDLLTREGGLGQGTARSYIGALCKSWSEVTVLDALMAAAGKADPKAYARKWLDDKPRKGQRKRSAAEELMEELNAKH